MCLDALSAMITIFALIFGTPWWTKKGFHRLRQDIEPVLITRAVMSLFHECLHWRVFQQYAGLVLSEAFPNPPAWRNPAAPAVMS